MGRWITSLSRRPLCLHTFVADSHLLVCTTAPLFTIKNQCEDSNCCPRFQAWDVFTNASIDSVHFSSIVSFCTALTFRPFSDWFRFPAAIPSSSGPKSSLHRVLSDGHVVRVLLAHQECLLYGRVHWAGPDLQIGGRGEVASGLSLRGRGGGGGGCSPGSDTGVSYYFWRSLVIDH